MNFKTQILWGISGFALFIGFSVILFGLYEWALWKWAPIKNDTLDKTACCRGCGSQKWVTANLHLTACSDCTDFGEMF